MRARGRGRSLRVDIRRDCFNCNCCMKTIGWRGYHHLNPEPSSGGGSGAEQRGGDPSWPDRGEGVSRPVGGAWRPPPRPPGQWRSDRDPGCHVRDERLSRTLSTAYAGLYRRSQIPSAGRIFPWLLHAYRLFTAPTLSGLSTAVLSVVRALLLPAGAGTGAESRFGVAVQVEESVAQPPADPGRIGRDRRGRGTSGFRGNRLAPDQRGLFRERRARYLPVDEEDPRRWCQSVHPSNLLYKYYVPIMCFLL